MGRKMNTATQETDPAIEQLLLSETESRRGTDHFNPFFYFHLPFHPHLFHCNCIYVLVIAYTLRFFLVTELPLAIYNLAFRRF